MPLSPGQILRERYRIIQLLGMGGFGAVYHAWDINLDRPRALKENLDISPQAQRQFKREAQILSDLTHPNLPKVIDHFDIPGQGQYLVMEYVEGHDLQEMLQDNGSPLPEGQVVDWISQICDALVYLHGRRPPVIHRDIKPANIRIMAGNHALLVDFGIAKVYDPSTNTTLGARAVTPGFSPQEQYGMGTTDARSDIYALGATLYALLTGQRPPDSIQRNLGTPLIEPHALNPAISPGIEQAILRAMQALPAQRYQTAAEFKAALASASVIPAIVQTSSLAGEASAAPTLRSAGGPGLVHQAAGKAAGLPAGVQNMGGATARWMLRRWSVLAAAGGLVAVALLFAGSAGVLRKPIPPTALAGIAGSTQTFTPLPPSPTELPPTSTSRPSATPIPPTQPSTASATPPPSFTPTRPPPTHTPGPGATQVSAADGMIQVFVPAGEFLMGSEDGYAEGDEQPQHTVDLDAYWIDRTEVTNAMYARCVQASVCPAPAQNYSVTRTQYYDDPAYGGYPVLHVSWQNARAYCEWAGRRLPTEAEWEKAARGESGLLYPWGQKIDCSRANYTSKDNPCVGDTTAAGSYANGASPYGALDMAGNVWEWVSDWYQELYYQKSPPSNPTGPADGTTRVVKGGSWYFRDAAVRPSNRDKRDPKGRDINLGFRCALPAAGLPTPTPAPSATPQGPGEAPVPTRAP